MPSNLALQRTHRPRSSFARASEDIAQGSFSHIPLSVPGIFPLLEFDPGMVVQGIPTLSLLALVALALALAVVAIAFPKG